MLALAYLLHEAQWVRRVDRRLRAPADAVDLDGLTIVHLSDFHAGFAPSLNLRAMRKAVDLALAADPDVVLLTGDFAGGPFFHGGLQRQLRRLRAPLVSMVCSAITITATARRRSCAKSTRRW